MKDSLSRPRVSFGTLVERRWNGVARSVNDVMMLSTGRELERLLMMMMMVNDVSDGMEVSIDEVLGGNELMMGWVVSDDDEVRMVMMDEEGRCRRCLRCERYRQKEGWWMWMRVQEMVEQDENGEDR